MKHLIDLLDRGELYDIFRNFGDMSGLGVSLRDLEGKELRKYSKKNEDIAAECLKYQRSRGKERQPVPEEILRHKPDVNLKKR